MNRLGDIIGSAQGESVKRRFRSPLRKRAEHHHGKPGIEFADFRQRLQAVQHWHFDVECDQIGLELRNFRQPDFPVARRSCHLQFRIGLHDFAKQLANHHRIVDNQNANCGHNAFSRKAFVERGSVLV
jgi:hypothetical protein